MRVQEYGLDAFLTDLKAGPFAFSRWGDGEWQSVLGRTKGANCDGHHYFPPLGADLRGVLESRPPYKLGMQPLARRLFCDKIDAYLAKQQLDLPWYDADILHRVSGNGRFERVVEALRARPLVVVGPAHLHGLKHWLGFQGFVLVPNRDSYLHLDTLFQQTLKVIQNMRRPDVVVTLSAGMPAKVLLHRLYQRCGNQATLLDFGSVLDPYAGVKSRKYMQNLNVSKIAKEA